MSSTDGVRHVVASPRVLTREVDGELVLLDLETETYLGLDAVALRMWKSLTAAASIDGAFDELLEVYDVGPDRLRADLDRLVDEMVRRGLIEVRDGIR